jgi:hypothetical protein
MGERGRERETEREKEGQTDREKDDGLDTIASCPNFHSAQAGFIFCKKKIK